MIANSPVAPNFNNKNVKFWFDELVENIRIDQLLIETDTAPLHKKNFYNTLFTGHESEIAASARVSTSMYFIKNLLLDYVTELKNFKLKPSKIALDLSDAKILVWAEIEDEDEETEDALILAEAKANSKYSDYGFHITSTIVEKSDSMPIPPHYQTLSF